VNGRREGGKNMGWERERVGCGRMKDNQTRERENFSSEVDFSSKKFSVCAKRNAHYSHYESLKHCKSIC
jgi:hypothetical protein